MSGMPNTTTRINRHLSVNDHDRLFGVTVEAGYNRVACTLTRDDAVQLRGEVDHWLATTDHHVSSDQPIAVDSDHTPEPFPAGAVLSGMLLGDRMDKIRGMCTAGQPLKPIIRELRYLVEVLEQVDSSYGSFS